MGGDKQRATESSWKTVAVSQVRSDGSWDWYGGCAIEKGRDRRDIQALVGNDLPHPTLV